MVSLKAGIPTFGPSSEAAVLDGSKKFMKNLCDKYDIPIAKYKTCTDASAAKPYILEQGASIVLKSDGLAAGKGVIIAMTLEEAYEAVDSMLVEGRFGPAGCKVIVEEEGEEASFFALVDGENAIALESAQDHKKSWDGLKYRAQYWWDGRVLSGMYLVSRVAIFSHAVYHSRYC